MVNKCDNVSTLVYSHISKLSLFKLAMVGYNVASEPGVSLWPLRVIGPGSRESDAMWRGCEGVCINAAGTWGWRGRVRR